MAERQRTERGLAIRQPREMMEDWVQRWEDFFERPFLPAIRRFFGTETRQWAPSIEVMEKENEYVIKAELPGVKEEDVEVSLTGDMLTISGEKQEEAEEERKGYYYSESSYGSFTRSLTIPSNVDPDNIEANFDKGVLEISLPKIAEVKPKKVKVSTGKKEKMAEAKSEGTAKSEAKEKGEVKGKRTDK